MRNALGEIRTLNEAVPPEEWQPAWQEWLAKIGDRNVTDDERLLFLRGLRIRADEDDLNGLEDRVCERLVGVFGVPAERISPLIDALHRALKSWTTGHLPVTAEHVFSELALHPERKDLAPAPPPPEPFFPSREPLLEELTKLLLADDTPPVVFLGAEPGAGKTSVLSRLANRRDEEPLSGLIGLRYFCFEPIRPDAPVIVPDVGRVRPENLWLSLLAQLREGLRGRLRELGVPLRNDLLTWQEAKAHVVRLAARLGGEWEHPFVIVVDGIDHAARAAQDGQKEAVEFFASLPGPDELTVVPVRLFLAGQPPEQYPRYPSWLQGEHPRVLKLSLGHLSNDDVRALYSADTSGLPPEQAEEAVRLIEHAAQGNTLATVFAVAEVANVKTLSDFAERLEQRRLHDGLESYYSAIWEHALALVSAQVAHVDASLVGTLCLARGGIAPELLAAAFSEWQVPAPHWRQLLEALGPLLVEARDGFRVRHNDVRLFLAARFGGRSATERRQVASKLADYYLSPAANRAAAYRALFTLLDLAGRTPETARIFDVGWVCGAAAVGIETAQLVEECAVAIRALPALHQWDSVLSLGCAVQTLERLHEQREDARHSGADGPAFDVPQFLPSEASVRPSKSWTIEDLSKLVSDAERLLIAGMRSRATGLLNRWLHGMSICDLVKTFTDMVVREPTGNEEQRLGSGVEELFANLGSVARQLAWTISPSDPQTTVEYSAVIAFERGYTNASCTNTKAQTLDELFGNALPRYLINWELAVEKLARLEQWTLLKTALERLTRHLPKLSNNFVAEAAWWALRSGAAATKSEWLQVMKAPEYTLLSRSDAPIDAFLSIARARGWEEVAKEPANIAEELYEAYDPEQHHRNAAPLLRLLFRGAAFIGRIRGVSSRSGWGAAGEIVTVAEARALLEALWNKNAIYSAHAEPFHGPTAAQIAAEIVEICISMPVAFGDAAYNSALPQAEQFPVDFRRRGLWRIVAFRGNRELLSSWVRHWLDVNGEVWKAAPSERAEIVQELSPLATDLGESALIEAAVERVNLSQIGYRSEERSFAEAIRWLRELCRREPRSWRNEGWKIWSLAEACQQQSCSVNAGFEMEATVLAAAMRSGPKEAWQLISTTLSESADRKWHYLTRNRLAGGFARAVLDGEKFPLHDRLALWCLVVAFCRWFDEGDIATLAELRDELLRACADNDERATWLSELERLTPSERERRPHEERSRKRDLNPKDETPDDYPLDVTLGLLEDGGKLRMSEASRAVRYIVRTNHPSRHDLIPRVLMAVGNREDYGIAWSWGDSLVDPALASIAAQATDKEFWILVSAIWQPPKDTRTWLEGTAENLHRLAFARARVLGVQELQRGFRTFLAMHGTWAFGGARWQPSWPALPTAEVVNSWDDFVLRMLEVLFTSRSGEVLSSAINGMHAFVELAPEVVVPLFQRFSQEWAQWWLLNAAESWATLHSDALEAVRDSLQQTMRAAHFEARMQAWIVLCKLADAQNRERPIFPMRDVELTKPTLSAKRSGILETSPNIRGLRRSVDQHAAAKGKLQRMKSCGFDFSSLQPEIAERLLAHPGMSNPIATLKTAPHRDNDFLCSPLDVDRAVGEAIEGVLSNEWCSQEDLPRLAQGLLDSEDPWLLRQTPFPSPKANEWPTEELAGSSKDTDTRKLIDRFRFLVSNQERPEDWTVAAACVYASTWQEDFAFFTWLEERQKELRLIANARRPTIPSGRTFNWWLGDHFEPVAPSELAVMGFFAGGMQRILDAAIEIQPSKLWLNFGWRPDSSNPLRLLQNGRCVAQYQRFHGKPKTSGHGHHHRQPLLHRWLVRTQEFLAGADALDLSFRIREDFERGKADCDS